MKKAPFLNIAVLSAFLVNTFGPVPEARAEDFRLPAPGVMVHLSPPLDPPILKGIKVHPENPFQFEFILDKGDGPDLTQDQLKDESAKLIKYFLASITVPEKDLWVNLSPYEKDRIIPQSFGLTEMGRDLLGEDYILKQVTASLIYPEDQVGKKFWKRIYEQAAQKFGTTNIPVNTFNKVWIVPEKAVVYENAQAGTAYVVESKLKVMLEEDYISLTNHQSQPGDIFNKNNERCPQAGCQANQALNVKAANGLLNPTHKFASQILREIVIPELTKEVNEDKNFAKLRQVYNSLILAAWYKKKIKDNLLEQVYADKNKINGINIDDPQEKEKIYQQYLKAFKKGVYNYIKEESDLLSEQPIPRKYFSGGVSLELDATNVAAQKVMVLKEGLPPFADITAANHEMIVKSRLQVFNGRDPAMKSTPFVQHGISPASHQAIETMLGQSRALYRTSNADDIDAQLAVYAHQKKMNYLRLTIRNQDDIERALHRLVVDDQGNEELLDGPAMKIIQEGGILLLDYNASDPKLAIEFNGLFDKNPTLFSHLLSVKAKNNLHVIGVIDEEALPDYSTDFLGRFVDETTHIFESSSQLGPRNFDQKNTAGFEVINLWQTPNVRDELIGSYRLDHGKVQAVKGRIIQAIESGKPVLIRDGVWEDQQDEQGHSFPSELRLLIRDIKLHGGVSFNGTFYALPPGFEFYQSNTSNLAEGVKNKTLHLPASESKNEEVWVINSVTQNMLFSRSAIKQGQIDQEEAEPLLKLPSVRLKITEKLDDWVWHRIMHASGKIDVEVLPGVYVPGVYTKDHPELRNSSRRPDSLLGWDAAKDDQVIFLESPDLNLAQELIKEREGAENVVVYPVTTATSSKDLIASIKVSKKAGEKQVGKMQFLPEPKDVVGLLKNGKTVILEGIEVNEPLLRELEGVLQQQPYLVENGKQISFAGKLYITARSGQIQHVTAAHHVVLETSPVRVSTRSGLNQENFNKVMNIQKTLEHAGYSLDFSLARLKRLATYSSMEEGINAVFAESLREEPEAAALVRVLARVNFGREDLNLNQIDENHVMALLDSLKGQSWSVIEWQLVDTLSTDLLREVGVETNPRASLTRAQFLIKRALIRKYSGIDPDRAKYYRDRFDIYSDVDDAPSLVKVSRINNIDMMSKKVEEALKHTPLLALIGLPGAGKSYTARAVAELLHKQAGLPTVGPITTGPDTREQDIVVLEDMGNTGTEEVPQAIAHWADLKHGGTLIIDEGNLVKNGLWNIFKGLFDEHPYIWINGKMKSLTKDHKVIITGNPYRFIGRHHQDIIDQYGLTLYFEPFTREEMQQVMTDRIRPYLPGDVDRRNQLIETILDLHFFFDLRAGTGQFSLRDIQELCKRVLADTHGHWQTKDVVLAAWSIYKGHFSSEQQEALKAVLKTVFNVDITALYQERINNLKSKYTTAFHDNGTELVDANAQLLDEVERTMKMRSARLSGHPVLDGKRGLIVQGAAGWGKDVSLIASLRAMGMRNAQEPDHNLDPTKNYYVLTASLSPQEMIQTIEKAKVEGSVVIIPEMNSLPSAFLEGKLNDALTGFGQTDEEVHEGFCLFATINPQEFSGREPLSSALLNRVIFLQLGDYDAKDLESVLAFYNSSKSYHSSADDIRYAVKAHLWVKDHVLVSRHKPTLRSLQRVLDLQAQEGMPVADAFQRVYGPFYLKQILGGQSLPAAGDLIKYEGQPVQLQEILQYLANYMAPIPWTEIKIGIKESNDRNEQGYLKSGEAPVIVLPKAVMSDPEKAKAQTMQLALQSLFERKPMPHLTAVEKTINQYRYAKIFKNNYPEAVLPGRPALPFAGWLSSQKELSSQQVFNYLVGLYLHDQIDDTWMKSNQEDIDQVFPGGPAGALVKLLPTLDDLKKTCSVEVQDQEELSYQEFQARQLSNKIRQVYSYQLPAEPIEFSIDTSPAPQEALSQPAGALNTEQVSSSMEVSSEVSAPVMPQLPKLKSKTSLKSELKRMHLKHAAVTLTLGVMLAMGGFVVERYWTAPTSQTSSVGTTQPSTLSAPQAPSAGNSQSGATPAVPKKVFIPSRPEPSPATSAASTSNGGSGTIILKNTAHSESNSHFQYLVDHIKDQYSVMQINAALQQPSQDALHFSSDVLKGYFLALADNAVDDHLQQLAIEKAKSFDPDLGASLELASHMLRSGVVKEKDLDGYLSKMRNALIKKNVYLDIYPFLDQNQGLYVFVYPMPVKNAFHFTPEQLETLAPGLNPKLPVEVEILDSDLYDPNPRNKTTGLFDGENAIVYSGRANIQGLPRQMTDQWTALHEGMHELKDRMKLPPGNNPELDSILIPLMFSENPAEYYQHVLKPRINEHNLENMYSQGAMSIAKAIEQRLRELNIQMKADEWVTTRSAQDINAMGVYIYQHRKLLDDTQTIFEDDSDDGPRPISHISNNPARELPVNLNPHEGQPQGKITEQGEGFKSVFDGLVGWKEVMLGLGSGLLGLISLWGTWKLGPSAIRYMVNYHGRINWKYRNLKETINEIVDEWKSKGKKKTSEADNDVSSPAEEAVNVLQNPQPRPLSTKPVYTAFADALREVSKNHEAELLDIFNRYFSIYKTLPQWSTGQTGINPERLIRTGGNPALSREDALMPGQERTGTKEIYLSEIGQENPVLREIARFLAEHGHVIKIIDENYTEDQLKQDKQQPNEYELMRAADFQRLFESTYFYYMAIDAYRRSPIDEIRHVIERNAAHYNQEMTQRWSIQEQALELERVIQNRGHVMLYENKNNDNMLKYYNRKADYVPDLPYASYPNLRWISLKDFRGHNLRPLLKVRNLSQLDLEGAWLNDREIAEFQIQHPNWRNLAVFYPSGGFASIMGSGSNRARSLLNRLFQQTLAQEIRGLKKTLKDEGLNQNDVVLNREKGGISIYIRKRISAGLINKIKACHIKSVSIVVPEISTDWLNQWHDINAERVSVNTESDIDKIDTGLLNSNGSVFWHIQGSNGRNIYLPGHPLGKDFRKGEGGYEGHRLVSEGIADKFEFISAESSSGKYSATLKKDLHYPKEGFAPRENYDALDRIVLPDGFHGDLRPLLAIARNLELITYSGPDANLEQQLKEAWQSHPNRKNLVIVDSSGQFISVRERFGLNIPAVKMAAHMVSASNIKAVEDRLKREGMPKVVDYIEHMSSPDIINSATTSKEQEPDQAMLNKSNPEIKKINESEELDGRMPGSIDWNTLYKMLTQRKAVKQISGFLKFKSFDKFYWNLRLVHLTNVRVVDQGQSLIGDIYDSKILKGPFKIDKGHFIEFSEDRPEVVAPKGGIDLTGSQTPLEIRNAGQAIKFHLDPAQIAQLKDAPGFVPVVISIQPMKDLRAFLVS